MTSWHIVQRVNFFSPHTFFPFLYLMKGFFFVLVSTAFHNFEHASHVTMSVTKLLARIVAPDTSNLGEEKMNARGLYDHTYGITSDPITQFSVILSALIHDAGKFSSQIGLVWFSLSAPSRLTVNYFPIFYPLQTILVYLTTS